MKKFAQRRLINLLQEQGITDQAVLRAMSEVPRPDFVEKAFAHRCYDNIALPIGEGQTISQPYIVAKMTELLALKPTDKVLEIGTGCGYQTAILAKLAEFVFSVERIKQLHWSALFRLRRLDIYNIQLRHGDGWCGWASKGPFDAIIVTAAPTHIPPILLEQLAEGGRMVLPLGVEQQKLKLITRYGDQYELNEIEPVKFVPLVQGDLL